MLLSITVVSVKLIKLSKSEIVFTLGFGVLTIYIFIYFLYL